jgi:hypothetical protein
MLVSAIKTMKKGIKNKEAIFVLVMPGLARIPKYVYPSCY